MGKWEKWGEIFFSKISQIQRNTPTKHWVFSAKTHTGKIRNFWNEKTEFDFCKNMHLRLYIFLVDKAMT